MDNRKYNIYFHTHTISGIIICVLLYVIFFAGSFAFFKDDFRAWQNNTSFIAENRTETRNFNSIIDTLARKHKLKGRDIEIFLQKNEMTAFVSMSASHDTTIKKKGGEKHSTTRRRGRGHRGDGDSDFFTYDFVHNRSVDYESGYDIGEFLYRLHFFAQLNVVPIYLISPFGYLLAGIVSFIFLFALISGLMLHWDKIFSNFFTFRPFSKWKTVWTDLHTALGVIGFPFQLIFAITGIVLIANIVLLAPYAKFIYKGNSKKISQELEYEDNTKYDYSYQPLNRQVNINDYVYKAQNEWRQVGRISSVKIKNFDDANMHIVILGKPFAKTSFAGAGKIVYHVRNDKMVSNISPAAPSSYVNNVRSFIYHIHFGDFGGRPLRVIYFVLGAMGCVVIISGILIWLVARDKNNVPLKKRVFNLWTANIFLACCLSMLPVTAFTLIAILIIQHPGQSDIYHLYFYSWLALASYFIVRKDLTITNTQSLVLSTLLCFLVPVTDGLQRNNWLWVTFRKGAYDVLFIDLLFLCLSLVSLLIFIKIRKKRRLLNSVSMDF